MDNRFPLLLFPIGAYNLLAIVSMFAGAFGASDLSALSHPWFTIPMTSPDSHWVISGGDIILLAGLICLFFEILKSTNTSNMVILNHALSMMLFIAALVEFLLLHAFATSTFFLLMVMAGLDVLAGFIITTIGARKDIGFGG